MYSVNFKFDKIGQMVYISHLDLMRLFMRAFRRSEFPLLITKGFNPHPKFSIKQALKLGLKGIDQEATIILEKMVSASDFKERLQEQLPSDIKIKEVLIYKEDKNA
ncbi:MAG: DUF2344 domain-containing protein [Candidatus Omnitrophota bacterium]|jgi:radical SAM-linked protein|nr:MAG: DUF2344 domain-containing protein [Candidatus Omnitrophota bacterium]